MNRRRWASTRHEAASTLLASLMMIVTLSAVTAAFIISVASRTRTAQESASWRQASLAAESGANLALVEIRRVLPDLNSPVTGAWAGWTSSSGTLPTGRTIPPGVTLSLQTPALTCAGEGNTIMTARVTLDAPAGMVDSSGNQWLRLRSRGTAQVPGSRRVSPDKLDHRLRRLGLVRDAALGEVANRPQVTRTIEMIVRPILPFRSAITSAGAITAQATGARVDSFDSRSELTSTFGEYDSSKRRSFGGVYTNGNRFTFAGEIRGSVGTNAASVQPSTSIIGTIDNNYFRPLPDISAPSWSAFSSSAPRLNVDGGTLASPVRIKHRAISGNLRIASSAPTVVDVWVDGDVNGSITVDDDIQARIFVDGNVDLDGLTNRSRRAGNLIIYGLPSATGAARTLNLTLINDAQAAIYAPSHAIRVTGDSDFMGSMTGQSFEATGSARFHFDEALAAGTGRVIDYRIASWVEEVF